MKPRDTSAHECPHVCLGLKGRRNAAQGETVEVLRPFRPPNLEGSGGFIPTYPRVAPQGCVPSAVQAAQL